MTKFFTEHSGAVVIILLGLMLVLGLSSMAMDSGIVDEVAHIPAGYSYLKFGDYRLNPEHPPLIKDLAAGPLLLLNLKFPLTIPAWTTEANGQWEVGWNFIYHIGNDAEKILFFSRLPILLLALLFGYVLYRFCKKRYGVLVALLTLFFFTLSPNLLAHSRLVTTDLGIAVFIFFAFATFFKFLDKPNWKTLWLATVFFALMQLAKFSAIIIYPFFGLLTLIAIVAWTKPDNWLLRLKVYGGGLLFIFIVSFAMIWVFYIPHTWNMPLDVQDRLITTSLQYGLGEKLAGILTKLNDFPGMKSIVQYLLGAVMVVNRVQGGNTTYFLGQVTNQSFLWYFPLSYLIKEPVPLLFLVFLTLFSGIYRYFKKIPLQIWSKFKAYAQKNFVELSFLLFVVFYSYISIKGNLNLGLRHLFPIVPIILMLVAKETVDWIKEAKTETFRLAYSGILFLLLTWYVFANFLIFPSYIAYFNEIIGGPVYAYKYVTDSNVDWGQDLKRLAVYIKTHPEMGKVAVDYFGGGDPKYYFCNRKFDSQGNLIANSSGYDCANSSLLEWHAENGRPPTKYIAVSETFLMNDIYWATLRKDEGYSWLRASQPIAKIGYSIYLYKIK